MGRGWCERRLGPPESTSRHYGLTTTINMSHMYRACRIMRFFLKIMRPQILNYATKNRKLCDFYFVCILMQKLELNFIRFTRHFIFMHFIRYFKEIYSKILLPVWQYITEKFNWKTRLYTSHSNSANCSAQTACMPVHGPKFTGSARQGQFQSADQRAMPSELISPPPSYHCTVRPTLSTHWCHITTEMLVEQQSLTGRCTRGRGKGCGKKDDSW